MSSPIKPGTVANRVDTFEQRQRNHAKSTNKKGKKTRKKPNKGGAQKKAMQQAPKTPAKASKAPGSNQVSLQEQQARQTGLVFEQKSDGVGASASATRAQDLSVPLMKAASPPHPAGQEDDLQGDPEVKRALVQGQVRNAGGSGAPRDQQGRGLPPPHSYSEEAPQTKRQFVDRNLVGLGDEVYDDYSSEEKFPQPERRVPPPPLISPNEEIRSRIAEVTQQYENLQSSSNTFMDIIGPSQRNSNTNNNIENDKSVRKKAELIADNILSTTRLTSALQMLHRERSTLADPQIGRASEDDIRTIREIDRAICYGVKINAEVTQQCVAVITQNIQNIWNKREEKFVSASTTNLSSNPMHGNLNADFSAELLNIQVLTENTKNVTRLLERDAVSGEQALPLNNSRVDVFNMPPPPPPPPAQAKQNQTPTPPPPPPPPDEKRAQLRPTTHASRISPSRTELTPDPRQEPTPAPPATPADLSPRPAGPPQGKLDITGIAKPKPSKKPSDETSQFAASIQQNNHNNNNNNQSVQRQSGAPTGYSEPLPPPPSPDDSE